MYLCIQTLQDVGICMNQLMCVIAKFGFFLHLCVQTLQDDGFNKSAGQGANPLLQVLLSVSGGLFPDG